MNNSTEQDDHDLVLNINSRNYDYKEEVNTIQEQISEPVVEKQNKSENSNSQSSNSSSKE